MFLVASFLCFIFVLWTTLRQKLWTNNPSHPFFFLSAPNPESKMVASVLLALCNTPFCSKLTKLHFLKAIFFIPTAFALLTTTSYILFYISSYSTTTNYLYPQRINNLSAVGFRKSSHFGFDVNSSEELNVIPSGSRVDSEVFHDRDFFIGNYKEMNKSFKIYVYPHRRDHPFANVLLPVEFEPGGNYASESYFKKVLLRSHFITKAPSEADLFFLPFSIARLRHDPRVGINGIQDFIRDYLYNISHEYPFWNRSGGSDHFYVSCHSVGRSAINKAMEIKLNAIQVVCSSSYYVSAYVAHKDASLPQIWPRQGTNPNLASQKREKLVFFAGSLNSPVREKLLQVWGNDTEISVHSGRLKRSYSEELLGSKFCLHVKGFEVNTARIGDAMYFGCVPVIIANHYDLPFADILNWKSFSVVVATLDIPQLKKILQGIIRNSEYHVLRNNLLNVRKHFQWHFPPLDYDAFYMVVHELWLRRNSLRFLGDVH